jgi:hypothetical protein
MAAQGLRREAGIGMFAVFAVVFLLIACRQVPDSTLDQPEGPTDEDRYARLVHQASEQFADTPRDVPQVVQAAESYAEAFKLKTSDYDALMQAVRVAAWLGGFHTDDKAREDHIRNGLTYVNTALDLRPGDLDATYYRGVLAGYLGDLRRTYGLDAVRNIEESMTTLIEAEHDIDFGGPYRVYGVLLMRAPGPPTSIGNMRNAGRNIGQAVEMHPDWPENQLYLAEWEMRQGKARNRPELSEQGYDRLREHLLGEEARAPQGYEFEFRQWQEQARKLLDDLS